MDQKFEKHSWTPLECSYLYHLIMWGYDAHKVTEIGAKLCVHRTVQSIQSMASYVRKWVSHQLGYPTSHYDFSYKDEERFEKASKLVPSGTLMMYKPEKQYAFKPVRTVQSSSSRTQPTHHLSPGSKPQVIYNDVPHTANTPETTSHALLRDVISQYSKDDLQILMDLSLSETGYFDADNKIEQALQRIVKPDGKSGDMRQRLTAAFQLFAQTLGIDITD